MASTQRARLRGEVTPWSRTRLLLALTGGALVVVALMAGLVALFGPNAPRQAAPILAVRVQPAAVEPPTRDQIAAAPMLSLPPEAATVPDPAPVPAEPIQIPSAVEGRGPAGIAVYPHTPEGAVGQLAAIDAAVLEAMSLPYTREMHAAWVLPGGPSLAEWDLTVNVAAFLRGARQGAAKDVTTVVRVAPGGGMVKGSDGADWVVACVLLDVSATVRGDYRMGWGNCHRMAWTDGRWQIAPGTQPAPAPSAWPGSVAARDAGWLTWSEAGR